MRFRHDGGAVIARTHGREERLTRAEAIARLRALDRDIDALDRSGHAYGAIQARADRRDLDMALRELLNLRRLQGAALARATARPSLCEAPRGA